MQLAREGGFEGGIDDASSFKIGSYVIYFEPFAVMRMISTA